MNARSLVLPAAAVSLIACGAGDTGPPAATVRDSVGIVIVENAYPDSADVPWWTLDPSPVLDIGGVEAEESYALYQVASATRLSDGRIVVANGGSADVRYYSATGEHLHTSGRRGEGPGEFQRPRQLYALAGDTVLVIDAFGSRATVLDPSGTYVRDFRLGGSGPGVGIAGRLADGGLVGTRNEFTGGDIMEGFGRSNVSFVTLTSSGEVVDTITTVPGSERRVNIERRGGQIQSIQVMTSPYSKSTQYAAAGNQLAVATQESPEVRVYDADGALRRIVRTGATLEPVTDAHLDAWFARNREAMPQELRDQTTTRPEWEDAGEYVPPFGALAFDVEGNLWLGDYDDRIHPAGIWSVHDSEGRFLARIRMPSRFRLLEPGSDYVLGVERDEFDVEHLRMYRFVKTE